MGSKQKTTTKMKAGPKGVVGWVYLIFFSNALNVRRVEVRGVRRVDPVDVTRTAYTILDERPVWRPWSTRHAWFVDRQSLADQLKQMFLFDDVSVDISYTGILRLNVTEQANHIVFHSHQQYAWINAQGFVTDLLSPQEIQDTQARILGQRLMRANDSSIIHQDVSTDLVPGLQYIDTPDMGRWLSGLAILGHLGLGYRELSPVGPSSTQAIISCEDDTRLQVDFADHLESQIKTYTYYRDHVKIPPTKNELIDARIPGKLFFSS